MYQDYTRIDLNTLSASAKEKEDYLITTIDAIIAELVYDKDHLKKAYNYYNGVRDEDQFRHLEENFGIGTPTSVEFIPLIKSHVDVLVGEHLQNKLKPYITCKDSETLSKINEEKMEYIYSEEITALKSQLASNLQYMLQSAEERNAQTKPVDNASEDRLKKMKRDIERDFISEFEISAHYVLLNLIQAKDVDLYGKLKTMFLDLLVAGQCYYKVTIDRMGDRPKVEVLNPFDVFYERNLHSPYIKDSTRVVHRRWMNRQQIITKYGRYLTQDEISELKWELGNVSTGTAYYVRACNGGLISNTGFGVTPSLYDADMDHAADYNLYPVYEVEWLANTKIKGKDGKPDYVTERYEGVRIGEEIYLKMQKSENNTSSKFSTHEACLSINGISYDERGMKPTSLVLMTANLQDKYDVLHFYRDNLIASSGVKGQWIDMSIIPASFGKTEPERLAKFYAYLKQGMGAIDTSQDGAGQLNTLFSGFDNTVSGDSIQAIQLAIDQTAETCSRITGVFQERLGGIEQRDAVSNVEVGIKQSAIITKQYYKMMDSITNTLLIDAINACKISYSEGMTGSLILGNKLQKVFTIDPDKFSFTDYDIHIADSGDMIKDMETIKMVSMELIKSGAVDIDIMLESLTSESLTEMKENVSRSYKEKKAENDQLNQAMQQVEQLQQQLQQTQQQLQKTATENATLKKQADGIREQEVRNRYRIETERNRITEKANDDRREIDEKKVEIELAQLLDNNPFNNDVKM